MQLVLYVLADRSLDGHVSFSTRQVEGEQQISIVVPDGSTLSGQGDFICLRTPDGKEYPATKVLIFCKVRVQGFGFPEAD